MFASENMISRLIFLLFFGNIALLLGNAQKLPRAKTQNLKVQINVTADAVCMRYLRSSPSMKLEGFILGYGSSFFSNQYISLPSDGKPYITELDAEPRYLISVRPAPATNHKKPCSGKTQSPKPLQLVIGTLTPTSVFLSWGILVNPKHDWTTLNNCANDRFYTVRYREKDKNKQWVLQLCPTTETVVDNLKPNTDYEFGVKDNTDNGIWSKILSHKVVMPSKDKENGELQNTYKLPKLQTQLVPGDSKVLHPITIIKQVLQNATYRRQSKMPEKSPLAGPILVHLIVPDLNGTLKRLPSSLTLDVPERPKKILGKNETQKWPAESKTSEIQEISPQSQPAITELDWESSKPTVPSVSEESDSFAAYTESELESSKPSITPMAELLTDTLAPPEFPEFSKTRTLPTVEITIETSSKASGETQFVPAQPQTPAPKSTWTKPVFSKTQPPLSRPRTPDEIDILYSKTAVTDEPTLDSLTSKPFKPLDWPRTTLAPLETPHMPFKWEPFATPERGQVKPAPNLPALKQHTSVTSRINEQLKITPAPMEKLFVLSTPKPSARLKITETKYEKEPHWETTTSKMYKTLEFPRTTLAPSKTKITVSKPQNIPHLEQPKNVPAVTRRLIPAPPTTKISYIAGYPEATMAFYEPSSVPSQSKESDYTIPELPDSKPDSIEADNFSLKQSKASELPFTKPVHFVSGTVLEPVTLSNELPIVAPKAKHVVSPNPTTVVPQELHTKPVLKSEFTELGTVPKKTETGERHPVTSRPKTWFPPDVPQMKPGTEAVTFRNEQTKSTIAPKGTRRGTPRPKTPRPKPRPSSGIKPTKHSSKGSRRVVSKPKTTPSPKIFPTKPAIIPFSTESSSAIMPRAPGKGKATMAEIIPLSTESFTAMMPRAPGKAKATMASGVEQFIPNKSKPSTRPRMRETKPAPKETRLITAKPKKTSKLDVPHTKPAIHRTTTQPLIIKPTLSSEQIKTTMAPKETRLFPSKPHTSGKLDVPHTKPAPKETRLITAKPKKNSKLDVPHTKPAIHRTTTQPLIIKPTLSSEQIKTTMAPKETRLIPSKPHTSGKLDVPHTKPAPKETRLIPSKPKTPGKLDAPYTKPAVHRTTTQPLIIKPTLSSEQIKTTMVPKETRLIPSKPKTSSKLDVPHTKPAPSTTYPGSINLHIHVNDPKNTLVTSKTHSGVTTTEGPHLKTVLPKMHIPTVKPKPTDKSPVKPVLNRTTAAPPRTRTPGGLAWGKPSRGDKLKNQDATKLLSTSSTIRSNASVHSSAARKKTDPVATPPDSPQPPLAPARPTPVRRKPLPPNTVTGKPGHSASFLAKPTGPSSLAKTSSPKKPPTAASSPDYSSPMFSSLPTTETDITGTPRYTGDHVMYMKKEEDVPCSITDTLQHFPTEEGDISDTATSPPRKPPTNLTVVTVEGCPSFVILDWEKPQNETVTEYKVVSTENGGTTGKDMSIITTNQTHSTVENLKPNTSYEFVVIPSNPLGEGPSTESKPFKTESADPRVTEPIPMGKDAIWTEIKFNSDAYSECKGKQYVKRTWYKKFVGVQLCNSLRYKIYLSDSLTGTFYNIGDQRGYGEDHCQFVDSYLDGRTGQQLPPNQLPTKEGFFRAIRQEPVHFGKMGAGTHVNYVHWYECGTTIPGKW